LIYEQIDEDRQKNQMCMSICKNIQKWS